MMRVAALTILLAVPQSEALSQGILRQFATFSLPLPGTEIDAAQLDKVIQKITIENASKDNIDIQRYLDPRIIGGLPADIKDSPWDVALIYGKYSEPLRAEFCGGSVIADNWVVTAAHCVANNAVNLTPSNVDVVANTTFYTIGGDRIAVSAIIVNEGYDRQTLHNDIALLKLSTHAATLKSVNLPNTTDALPDATNLTVTGWGAMQEGTGGTAYLIGADIPVVSNEECNRPESYGGIITSSMICAGRREGGLDACQGDSGGGAVATAGTAKVLMGIVSFGAGCAERNKYGVYTNVRAYRDWIVSNIK